MHLRIFVPLLLLISACSSGTDKPVIAKGEIRYLQDLQELKGEISLYFGDSISNSYVFRPASGAVAFLGSAMQAEELSTRQRWTTKMKAQFPHDMRFTFPTSEAEDAERITLPINFTPPHTDSIPEVIDRQRSLRFPAGDQALGKNENIVVFFEPIARELAPRRIIVAGPTQNEKITLPSNTMTNITPGEYNVYFVKQQLARDTVANVRSAIQVSYHTRNKRVTVE